MSGQEKFARFVMNKRDIIGFRVQMTDGNEGFCDFGNKKILLGKNASNRVVLHEIAHIIAGSDGYHYSAEFEKAWLDLRREFEVA